MDELTKMRGARPSARRPRLIISRGTNCRAPVAMSRASIHSTAAPFTIFRAWPDRQQQRIDVCGISRGGPQRSAMPARHEVLGVMHLDAFHDARGLGELVRESLALRYGQRAGERAHHEPRGHAHVIEPRDVGDTRNADRAQDAACFRERYFDRRVAQRSPRSRAGAGASPPRVIATYSSQNMGIAGATSRPWPSSSSVNAIPACWRCCNNASICGRRDGSISEICPV